MKRNLVIIVLTAAMLAAIVGIAFNIYDTSRKELISEFQDRQFLIAREVAREMERQIGDRIRYVEKLCSLASVQYLDKKQMPEEIRAALGDLEKAHDEEIYVLDERGTVIYSSDASAVGSIRAQQDFFEQARQPENRGKAFGSTFIPQMCKHEKGRCELHLLLVMPLYQVAIDPAYPPPTKAFAGVVALEIGLDDLLIEQVALAALGARTHQGWVIAKDGTVLFHSEHPEMVLNNVHRTDASCVQCHVSFDHVEKILNEKQGVVQYALRDRPARLAAFAPMTFQNAAWIVVANVPYADVTAAVAKHWQKTMLLLGLVVLGAGGSFTLLYRGYRSKVRAQEEVAQWREKQALNEKIRQSEERYRSIFENAVVGIFQTTIDGKFLTVNPTLAQIFGYDSPAELMASVASVDRQFYVDPRRRQGFVSLMEERGFVSRFESEVYRKDGSDIWISEDVRVMRDASGKTVGYEGTAVDITERKRAERELERTHRQLLDASRQAGMAEVATSVLHNVGNVLNSVNVSVTLIAEKVKRSPVGNFAKAAALLREHEHELADYLTRDPKGSQLPTYLTMLSEYLAKDQAAILGELEALTKNVDHIKDIVAMQQSYSTVAGFVETLPVVDVVEDAVRLNDAALGRHQVKIIREYEDVPPVPIQRHKLLQILVNLVRNAKHALDEDGHADKRLTVRIGRNGNNTVNISVIDNGVGIPPENLTRIFEHGFTTRKDGHGFGLHSAALAAKELGGALTVRSDGPGKGATFTLELPLTEEEITS